MQRKQKLLDCPLLFLGLIFFILAGIIQLRTQRPILKLSKQDTTINFNVHILKFLNGGNTRLITDLIWIQTLLESDLEHYKGAEYMNWMYLRFFTISQLDPKFYNNYLYGGQYLSIIKDDVSGADRIYSEGLKHFPDDYALLYNAGFNKVVEMGDTKSGFDLLKKIYHDPRLPPQIRAIVNKLEFEASGNFDLAFEMVKDQYENHKEDFFREKLWADLYAIKAEKDLNCLNSMKSGCDHFDLNGDRYIKQGTTFHAPRPFKLFRLKKLKR